MRVMWEGWEKLCRKMILVLARQPCEEQSTTWIFAWSGSHTSNRVLLGAGPSMVVRCWLCLRGELQELRYCFLLSRIRRWKHSCFLLLSSSSGVDLIASSISAGGCASPTTAVWSFLTEE